MPTLAAAMALHGTANRLTLLINSPRPYSMTTPSAAPLTDAQWDFLESKLEQYKSETSVWNTSELDGYLTALVSGPKVIAFEEWFEALWGGSEFMPVWENAQEAKRFIGLVIQHMNEIAGKLMENAEEFSPIFMEDEHEDGHFTLSVEDWCFGYERGVVMGDGWEGLPEEEQELLACILVHTYDDESDEEEIDPEEAADMVCIGALTLHAYWLAQRTPSEPVRTSDKVGRNDPCPCGSGKKFKQCCLH
ncbi:UPF0149 family protein [Pseudomonas sp.]|uniref:UPF0149 family protein n=1 Tax=Pseudomonas sp. TaxID=306 RepID=UPI00338F8B37